MTMLVEYHERHAFIEVQYVIENTMSYSLYSYHTVVHIQNFQMSHTLSTVAIESKSQQVFVGCAIQSNICFFGF